MSEIYVKFLSAKTYTTIPIDVPVISVASLKQKIFQAYYKSKKKADSRGLCVGTDFDFVLINAQTNECYFDDKDLIHAHSSVLIRRVPGTRRLKPIDTSPIVFTEKQKPKSSVSSGSASWDSSTIVSTNNTSSTITTVTSTQSSEDDGFGVESDDGFGGDVYANPGLGQSVKSTTKLLNSDAADDDEDTKIKALVNTPALDGYDVGSFVMGSRGRGFGGILNKKKPPVGYVCRRCKKAGHFIQHCPTNGDSIFDFKRIRNPTVMQSNEAVFDKLMADFPSRKSRSESDIPAELMCPLCKNVMKDAVMSSRCCLKSFCDKCIREHLIQSKLKCECGATNVLTDYLIPNMTLRHTIKHILECGHGNTTQIAKTMLSAEKIKKLVAASHHEVKKARTTGVADVSEATVGSITVKEPAPQVSVQANNEEMQRKMVCGEKGKNNRKRKSDQNVEAGNFMMPMSYHYGYNPYWIGMQTGMRGYEGAINYGMNHFGMQFNYLLPQESFSLH